MPRSPGRVTCVAASLDPGTGEVHKRGRLARGKMRVFASPVAGDGKVYFASVEGLVVVVKAAPRWEVLAVNDLEDEIYASPAIVDGHIYVRTKSRLYRFSSAREAAEASPPGGARPDRGPGR